MVYNCCCVSVRCQALLADCLNQHKSMKNLLQFLVAAFLLSAIMPVHATEIVYGTISGVVVDANGPVRTAVGDTVSGTFSYDYDLLSPAPDSPGNLMVSQYDPNASFIFQSSVGEGVGSVASGLPDVPDDFLFLIVNANGLPVGGGIIGDPADLGINPSFIGVVYGQNVGWGANVTYTITGVPDVGATWFLLGLGLASIGVARRFFCQMWV